MLDTLKIRRGACSSSVNPSKGSQLPDDGPEVRGEGKKTYCTSSDITFLQLPEPISISTCLIHLPQRDVHKVVAVY